MHINSDGNTKKEKKNQVIVNFIKVNGSYGLPSLLAANAVTGGTKFKFLKDTQYLWH